MGSRGDPVNLGVLMTRQWEGYARYHQARANLLIHIVAVPLFLVANVALVAEMLFGRRLFAVLWFAVMVLSIAAQGRGHKGESVPPEPFTSPLNAIVRLCLEQWVTFPRFVLSGGWLHALRAASSV